MMPSAVSYVRVAWVIAWLYHAMLFVFRWHHAVHLWRTTVMQLQLIKRSVDDAYAILVIIFQL